MIWFWPYAGAHWLIPRAVRAGVRLLPSSYVESVEPGLVTVASVYGGDPRRIEADNVIVCMMRRQNEVPDPTETGASYEVRLAGDCASPRGLDEAVYDGARAGQEV
jgi:hypothetical protein